MTYRMDHLAGEKRRLDRALGDLSLGLSRGTPPASHEHELNEVRQELDQLIGGCRDLSEKLGEALLLMTGSEERFLADWERIRKLANQALGRIDPIRALVKNLPSASPPPGNTQEAFLRALVGERSSLRTLSLALGDLVNTLPERIADMADQKKMPVNSDVKDKLAKLRTAIDDQTRTFVRTTPFASVEMDGRTVDFDLKDLLLIGALTHADVLLAGKTGSGKTKLAMKVMEALFGKESYYSKTTLPSMSPSDFMDIDFRGIKAGQKTLRQAIEGVPALILPGIILNEANRAPAAVQAMLIPFLDREFEIEGEPVDLGALHGGERYQYHILTVNEGEEYSVEEFDRALRDRAVFQIPVDVFPQGEKDVYDMIGSLSRTAQGVSAQGLSPQPCPSCRGTFIRRKGYAEREWEMVCMSTKSDRTVCHHTWKSPDNSLFPTVLELYDALRQMPMDEEARYFLVYLSGLGNCVRSLTGYKDGIRMDPNFYCNGCTHAKHYHSTNLCGNVRAPSARALVNLHRVAQGFALLRAWRMDLQEVSVALEDLVAAGPFVLRGKLHLTPKWLQTMGPHGEQTETTGRADFKKGFNGCEWEAIRHILKFLRSRFQNEFFKASEFGLLQRHLAGNKLSADDVGRLIQYAEGTDNWAVNKVRMEKHRDRIGKGAKRT